MFAFPIKDTYQITQEFGENLLNYGSLGLVGHNGRDIACATGTGVHAVDDGTITVIKNDQALNDRTGYGNYIGQLISQDRPNAYYDAVYGHLLTVYVAPGDKVTKGQLIGLVDNTGFSTGSHLHFGARVVEKRTPQTGDVSRTYLNQTYVLVDYNNGYFGYINPKPLFDPNQAEIVYPVDNRYGQEYSPLREKAWTLLNESYAKKKCQQYAIPYTDRIKKAFVYGYYDAFTNTTKDQYGVFDVAMYETWLHITKPALLKKFGR